MPAPLKPTADVDSTSERVGVDAAEKSVAGPTQLTYTMPVDGASTETDLVFTFSWAANQPLEPGQVYELVFWKEEESQSDARAYDPASISANRTFKMSNFSPGRYRWGVYLASESPYRRLRYLGNTLSFSVTEKEASDGG